MLAILWVFTIVDIVRRHYSAGATVGWMALILVAPVRRGDHLLDRAQADGGEVEQAMLKNADSHLRHDAVHPLGTRAAHPRGEARRIVVRNRVARRRQAR